MMLRRRLCAACGNIFHAIWQKVSLRQLEVVLVGTESITGFSGGLALISS